MPTKKPVEVVFVRGPLHLVKAKLTWIPDVNIFSDPRDRKIYAYVREDLVYYFDPEMSCKLSKSYDLVVGTFKKNPVEIVGKC